MNEIYQVGATAEGMVPKGPIHIAAVVSITPDSAIHVGLSAHLISIIGKPHANRVMQALANDFAKLVPDGPLTPSKVQ